jgi:hypothetical protein
VSLVTERLWQDYQTFASRDLAEHDVVYLFVGGIAERLHLGQPREAALAAWWLPGASRVRATKCYSACAGDEGRYDLVQGVPEAPEVFPAIVEDLTIIGKETGLPISHPQPAPIDVIWR